MYVQLIVLIFDLRYSFILSCEIFVMSLLVNGCSCTNGYVDQAAPYL